MRRSILLALAIAGCAEKPAVKTDSGAARAMDGGDLAAGESRLAVADGRIWYKKSGTGSGMPVILLHGGPGFNSFYLKPIEAIGDDRPVIRYDQLGAGKSDKITDTAMFNIAHFVRELDSLRAHLGYDKVHLLGHSWGTILAVEYYKVHPEHVTSMILGSAALDIPAWERNAKQLVKTLPDSMQRTIAAREKEGKFDAPDYQAALGEFYSRYVWRHPVEADLDSTMKTINEGIYGYMQGPSEFTIVGTLKKYDATPFLESVKVPVLYTVGEFDEANPTIIRKHAAMTPGAKVEVIPGAAHVTTWDNPTVMVRVVRDFLRSADPKK